MSVAPSHVPVPMAVVLTLLAVTLATACGDGVEEPSRLRVLAAASLADVVTTLAELPSAPPLEPGFGSSSSLARQIRDGAPADVFLSASADWMDFLREAGAVDGEPTVLARNRLVAIAARPGPLADARLSGPAELLERLGDTGGVAITDAGVPAGEYARASLRALGLLETYRRHLVGQSDVRAVLRAVERGELDAGFTYATDARVADVVELFAFDPTTHPPIEYQAAALRGAADPAGARAFLDLLRSPAALTVLVEAGFAAP